MWIRLAAADRGGHVRFVGDALFIERDLHLLRVRRKRMFIDDDALSFPCPSRFAPSIRTAWPHRRALLRAEFAIERGDVDGDALAIAPAGEIIKSNRARRFQRAHAAVVTFPRFVADISEIIAHARHALRLSVTGPWPGTMVSASMPTIISHAAIQLPTGPAQMIG